MRKPLSITGITLKQGFRNQTFWIAAFLFVSFFLVVFFLRVLSIGHKAMMLRSFALSAMEISALLLVVYGFVFSLFRERENRIQSLYLTYVSSWEYLFGKFIGHCLLTAVYLVIASLLCIGLLLYERAFSFSFLLGVYSIFLKLCITCSFCLFFACLLSSPILASFLTFFLYLAGELSSYPLMVMKSSTNWLILLFYRVLYHLLPNMDKIDLKYQAIWEQPVAVKVLIQSSLYTFLYALMIFMASLWIFMRREH